MIIFPVLDRSWEPDTASSSFEFIHPSTKTNQNNPNRILPYLYFSLTDDGNSITDATTTYQLYSLYWWGKKTVAHFSLSLCRVPSFENRVTLPATKSLKRERERLFRCPNRRESRPLPTCTRRREGQGPLFFLSLLSCCYEYMEENGEPFLRIDLVGSETGTPFSRQIPSRRYSPHRPTMTSSIQWRVWPLLITHSDCIDSSVLHKRRLEMIFRNCLVR